MSWLLLILIVSMHGLTIKTKKVFLQSPFNPRERPGTHYTGGWVGTRAGLDGRKKSPHRDSIPGPSSP